MRHFTATKTKYGSVDFTFMFSIIIYATFLFIPLTMEGINEFALCNLFSCIQLLLIFFLVLYFGVHFLYFSFMI